MRLLRRAEAFGGDDARPAASFSAHRARAHRRAVDQHGARAALAEAAAELGAVQAEVVAQRVEQRHVGIPGVDGRWRRR